MATSGKYLVQLLHRLFYQPLQVEMVRHSLFSAVTSCNFELGLKSWQRQGFLLRHPYGRTHSGAVIESVCTESFQRGKAARA
jgi:hypothetical protein